MGNLARPELLDNVGAAFVRTTLADGSVVAIAPLLGFLANGDDQPYLRSPSKTARAALFADIAHFMNISHGGYPGIIEHAASKITDNAARKWLVDAIDAMLSERTFLNRLTVTAGPIRRLRGQNELDALVLGLAKSFQMLATSDRKGCAAGTAIAFVIDWHQTRPLLDIVASEIGLTPSRVEFPSVVECEQLVQNLDHDASYRRAMAFGAEQTLAQQRRLWQLIVARHIELLAT